MLRTDGIDKVGLRKIHLCFKCSVVVHSGNSAKIVREEVIPAELVSGSGMTFLEPGSKFKGRVELAQVPFLESYSKKKNCFIKMPLDLNSFLEVAVADHLLGCNFNGF